MVPMRSSRVVLAFVVAVAALTGLQALAGWAAHTPAEEQLLSTVLTCMAIVSYTWVAPPVLRFLAMPAPADPAAASAVEAALRLIGPAAQAFSRIQVVDNTKPLAIAVGVPGWSTIFVTNGLIEKVSPATLRFILAHELTHVRQRHALWTSIVFASIYGVKFVFGLPAYAGIIAFVAYLAFMRRNELAADRGASDLLGAPAAGEALLELGALVGEPKAQGPLQKWLTTWLSTHPSFAERAWAVRAGGVRP